MTDPTIAPDDTLAKRRFFAIAAVRVVGVILAMVGMLILRGRIGATLDPTTAQILGFAMLIVGLFDVMLMPRILSRRWRTPG